MARTLTAAAVRARMAAALVPRTSVRTVGRFTLRGDQREHLVRIEAALRRFGGALLCDPPGSGKTVVGLAVAHARRGSGPALVLAPASLREQWERSARSAETPIVFRSLESVSRGGVLPSAPLLIVDEAHRLGNGGTKRYSRIAAYAARAPILLLTATPVVNRVADRDRLLGLFLGARRVDEFDDVVIRRHREALSLPPVRRLSTLEIGECVPGLAHALRSLPPPFPVADGRAATALVRSTLAYAWRSSLAALAHALKRRELNGSAFAEELAAGRWPNRHTLRRWIIGDEPTQLTLGLGLDSPNGASPSNALPILRRHLDAIRELRLMISSRITADTEQRAAALCALLHQYAPARTVCFAHHAETVRALWSALRRTPGVVAITGERVHAAAGRWSREEVLQALGPHGGAWRSDDPRGIRLLLTTDLLAEGVELPGVEIVVHGDGAWTPARLEQRVGRARRPSSQARAVLVTGFRAPAGIGSLLNLGRRLRAKRTARRVALATADTLDALQAEMARWRSNSTELPPHVHANQAAPLIGAVAHSSRAFLALVEGAENPQLIAAQQLRGRWRVSTTPRALTDLALSAGQPEAEIDTSLASNATQLIDRWLARNAVRQTVGATRDNSSATLRVLRRRLGRAVERAALSERSAVASRVQRVMESVSRSWTVRIDRELRALLRADHAGASLLKAVESVSRPWMARKQTEPRTGARLVALLLFQPNECPTAAGSHPGPTPSAPVPPSASP